MNMSCERRKRTFLLKSKAMKILLLVLVSLICVVDSDVSILSVTVTPSSGIVGIGDSVIATVRASVEVCFSLDDDDDVINAYITHRD